MCTAHFARFLGRLNSDEHLAVSIGGGSEMVFGN